MKIKCNQKELKKLISTVKNAVQKRTTIPMLKGIYLNTTGENILKARACNGDIEIESKMECEIIEPGTIIIPAEMLSDIVAKFYSEDVSMETKNDREVKIKSGDVETTIVTIKDDGFPIIGKVKKIDTEFTFKKEDIEDLIRKTGFCASQNQGLGIYNGILFSVDSGFLKLVSTDKIKLAYAKKKLENYDDEKKVDVVIPYMITNEVLNILRNSFDEGDVKFSFGDKKVVVQNSEFRLVGKVFDKPYIPYEKLLAFNDFKTEIKFDKTRLRDAIERAMIISKTSNDKTMSINVEGNFVTLKAASEMGISKETINTQVVGKDVELFLNSNELNEILKAIEDDEIMMGVVGIEMPYSIYQTQGEDFIYQIIPVRRAL